MSLDEYRRKRDAARTPEPWGSASPARPRPASLRRFVVQRHRASRLHYDLRLEVGDVLASWAVPRGPSMRPLEKRRAARTEDHPLEYLDFEGIIPAGEYGGGDSIVWDHGAWDPELPDDPAASIESGELKFALYGERLRGRFVLVRTGRGRGGSQDWLLIHKQDADADAAWDIGQFPTSVLSGRTNEELAAGTHPGAGWQARSIATIDLSAAKEARHARFIEPMLATPVDAPFSHPEWLYELKLDGYRVQAHVAAGAVRLWTRSRADASRSFPGFASAAPDWIASPDAIVDGEMVALDANGRPDFGLLQELAGTPALAAGRGERRHDGDAGDRSGPADGILVYHAFDLLRLDGLSLLDVPLEERKRVLRLVLRPRPGVRFVSHVIEHGEEFQTAVAAQGLEGSMAKRRRSRYEPGTRSRAWCKVKVRREQDLVVIGYEPGRGSHAELGSLIVATHEQDGWRFAGHVGSGIDAATRSELRRLIDERPATRPAAPDTPASSSARYGEPRLVIRATYSEWTSGGLLRHAVYRARDHERDPLTVAREVARSTAEVTRPRDEPGRPRRSDGAVDAVSDTELAALEELGDVGTWEVGGYRVELTNLDKVLFPAAGFTKRDLVRYYTTIAATMLPYLRARPLNVHRWPDGVDGRTRFWQKQIPDHAPEWVARWDYPEAGRGQSHTYVVADRAATLAWLANQAAIDLHPWTSRLPDYRRPTYAYIDIDPGTDTSWEQLLTLARLYRTALEHLGVRGHPKLSGKRGIQIWIGLEPRYTFDQTREWVGALSRGVGAVVPELVSWEWARRERGGRARLDYTQNSMVKTLVAPYAVRPVGNGAVSAPITWDELDDPELRPGRWDMRTIVERVAQRGDLFSGVLDDPQQLPTIS